MSTNVTDVRITFGMIVLNGEPFIKYNLRAIYPFACQIIVVEGANRNSVHCATPDGHSIDSTLATLRDFKEHEDPDDKLIVVTAEDEGHPSGFWPGEKDEQSQAYAKRATGNWLWQVDVDEFYDKSAMRHVVDLISHDAEIATISFPEIPFWGSFDYRCDGIFLRIKYSEVHRLFKWAPGYRYLTHRPVTVINQAGKDLRQVKWVRANDMQRNGVYMYHYWKIFPSQVSAKMTYYANLVGEGKSKKPIIVDGDKYYDDTFLKLNNPFRIHTVNTWPSWLEPFSGSHPTQIQKLKHDLESGKVVHPMRDMEDVDKLVKSVRYRLGILFWKGWGNYATQTTLVVKDLLRRRIGVMGCLRELGRIAAGVRYLFAPR